MKLDRLAFSQSFGLGVALVATVALACGCSTAAPARTASAARAEAMSAEAANLAGTTNLMSAQLAGPAPRVGKSHLVVDDLSNEGDIESGSTSAAAIGSDLDAPKEARRSDGSRRGGGFGSSK